MGFVLTASLLIFMFVLITLSSDAKKSEDNRNTKGRAFMVSFFENVNNDSQHGIIITSERRTRIYVQVPSTGTLLQHSLQANSSVYLKLPQQTTVTSWGITERKAVSIYSTEPVSVYGFATRPRSSGGYLAIPMDKWSDHYIVATFDGFQKSRGEIIIICAEDNTSISVWLNVVKFTRCVTKERTVDYSMLLSFNMNREDVLRIACDDDLSGSVIKGSKAIGVISGNVCTQVSTNVPYCDHLVEMMIPTTCLGRDYIVAALGGRDAIFRVIYTDDKVSTNVTAEYVGEEATIIKSNRLYKEYRIASSTVVRLHTSKPALLVLYSLGTNNNMSYGDPSMTILAPIERYDSSYSVATDWKTLAKMSHFTFGVNVYSPGNVSSLFAPRADVLSSESVFGFTVTQANITNSGFLSRNSVSPDSNIIFSAWSLGAAATFPVGMKLDFFTGVDNCSASPCLNQGICYSHGQRLLCYCGDQLSGDQCQNDIVDACTSYPCQNNSTCIDLAYMFKCMCPDGFTGDLCETDKVACGTEYEEVRTTSKPKTTIRETEMCTCTCENVTSEEIEDKTEQIKNELTVDVKETNKNKIRHTSAYDPRPSAAGIGIVGILFLILVFGCFVILDLITAVAYIVTYVRNWRRSEVPEHDVDQLTVKKSEPPLCKHSSSSTKDTSLQSSVNTNQWSQELWIKNVDIKNKKSELGVASQPTSLDVQHVQEKGHKYTEPENAKRKTTSPIGEAANSNLLLLHAQSSTQLPSCTHKVVCLPRFQTEANKILVVGGDGKTFRIRKCSWSLKKHVVSQTCHMSEVELRMEPVRQLE